MNWRAACVAVLVLVLRAPASAEDPDFAARRVQLEHEHACLRNARAQFVQGVWERASEIALRGIEDLLQHAEDGPGHLSHDLLDVQPVTAVWAVALGEQAQARGRGALGLAVHASLGVLPDGCSDAAVRWIRAASRAEDHGVVALLLQLECVPEPVFREVLPRVLEKGSADAIASTLEAAMLRGIHVAMTPTRLATLLGASAGEVTLVRVANALDELTLRDVQVQDVLAARAQDPATVRPVRIACAAALVRASVNVDVWRKSIKQWLGVEIRPPTSLEVRTLAASPDALLGSEELLVQLLVDPPPSLEESDVIAAMGVVGRDSSAMAESLVRTAKAPGSGGRWTRLAVHALARMGPNSAPAQEWLTSFLECEVALRSEMDASTCELACDALRSARPGRPDLASRLSTLAATCPDASVTLALAGAACANDPALGSRWDRLFTSVISVPNPRYRTEGGRREVAEAVLHVGGADVRMVRWALRSLASGSPMFWAHELWAAAGRDGRSAVLVEAGTLLMAAGVYSRHLEKLVQQHLANVGAQERARWTAVVR